MKCYQTFLKVRRCEQDLRGAEDLLDPREAAKVIEDLLYLRAPSKVKHGLNLSSTTPAKVADNIRVYVPDKQPRMSNVTKVR